MVFEQRGLVHVDRHPLAISPTLHVCSCVFSVAAASCARRSLPHLIPAAELKMSAEHTEAALGTPHAEASSSSPSASAAAATPSHVECRCCGGGSCLSEDLPAFFLAESPSAARLEAFKAFSRNAKLIRHELSCPHKQSQQHAAPEADPAGASPHRARGPLAERTRGHSGKGGASRAAAHSAASASAAGEQVPADDAYPEVPELAGSVRLLRFLQGFDFDVNAATEAYRRHMKWRADMGLDAHRRRVVVESMLLPMRPEAAPRHLEVSRFFPTNPVLRLEGKDVVEGEALVAAAAAASAPGDPNSLLKAITDEALNQVLLDKHGNIISIERPGRLDASGLLVAVTEEDFLLWHSFVLDFRCMLLDMLSRKFNRMVRMTSIVDLQGLSARILNRRALNLLRRTISAASENYPESIGAMYFINTPRTFSTIWSAMKGWLRQRTIGKITLLGGDAETVLVRNIGGYALPLSLGGSCTSALADVHQQDEGRETDLGAGSLVLNVAARKCNQAVEVVPRKSIARWVWVAEDFDVGFSAIWRAESGQERVIQEHCKYPARKKVRGVVRAEHDGTLILAFDNSWGLIYPRRVRYKIEIESAAPPAAPAESPTAASSSKQCRAP
ncbi:hypothetical protein Esti_002479 [Eimeria stiedai]